MTVMSGRGNAHGLLAVLCGVGVFVAQGGVRAANGVIPRTPAVFHREACLSVVDRSVDARFVVDVSIPREDTQLTEDELPDSRRFQFFALCRDTNQGWEPLPNWVSTDDAQRSLSHDPPIIEELPAPADVLETSEAWSDCAYPINGAQERIPITCAALDGGVTWDASSVPAGNYVLRGYTFEPDLNRWAVRAGVVQVRDGGNPLPVASLTTPAVSDLKMSREQGFPIRGCMDGPAGTTVTLSWASVLDLEVDDPSDWHDFATLDAAQAMIEVDFAAEGADDYDLLAIRARAQAPDGASWDGYAPGTLIVYPDGESDDAEPPAAADHCGFFPDPSGTASSGTDSDGGATSTGGGSGSSAPMSEMSEGDGCQCRSNSGKSGWPLWSLLAFAAALTRRRG